MATAGLTACTSMFGGEPLRVRPVENVSSLTPAQSDPLYESAVTAINSREYARALDYLQQAKAQNPKNIQVLNALGVVYDKLGRFDLSARYYGQAQAVDPSSRIVAANIQYSKILQGWKGQDQAVAALETPGEKSGPAEKMAAIPPAQTVAAPAPLAMTRPATALSTHSPMITAPAIQPVGSSTVVLPIPPEIVMQEPVEKKTIMVQPEPPASIRPIVQSQGKQTVASLAHPEANSKTMAVTDAGPSEPAHLLAPPKLPAAVPTQTNSAVPDTHPVNNPTAGLSSSLRTASATGTAVAVYTSASTVTVSAPAAQPAVLPIRAASGAPVARPAEERTVAISMPQHVAPKPTSAHGLESVPPASPREKRIATALPVQSDTKPLQSTMPKLAAPVSLRTPIVSNAPVKAALAVAGNRKVLTIGKPVKLLNASGKPGGIGTISHRLAALGWTVKQFDWRMQPATTLYYPAKNLVAAKAMLRTLPFPARFTLDNDSSFAMRLVIGRDILSWKPKNSRLVALWLRGTVVASSQKPSVRGVR
jgi:hypothetical protein